MALPVKYAPGSSTGLEFEIGEKRTVFVTVEANAPVSGYAGDMITYTATVKAHTGDSLPATFVADLELGAAKVITGQAFDAAHYDQTTSLLTLTWQAPAIDGTFTVKLVWAEQLI